MFGLAALDATNIICFITKQATLMRRSTLHSLCHKLPFGYSYSPTLDLTGKDFQGQTLQLIKTNAAEAKD
jgi:hypothetical protein